VLYYGIRYRKKVVFENLRNSFPEKNEKEIEVIAKKFFAHLCDLIFESIKGCTISKKEVLKRHSYLNPELLDSFYEKGGCVTILGSHYANWEWVALSLPLTLKFQTYGIYFPLSQKFLDKALKKSRARNGMKLISTKEVTALLREQGKERITMGYISDQSPSRHGRYHWVRFLNQDTAAISGFENLAKEHNSPVVYLNITKKKRGYYEGEFSLIAAEPQKMGTGQIVEAYMQKLESVIRTKPEHWLWSHKRWKIKR
jgi:KDO2-lipid IV(A) lauroyltransferase